VKDKRKRECEKVKYAQIGNKYRQNGTWRATASIPRKGGKYNFGERGEYGFRTEKRAPEEMQRKRKRSMDEDKIV
jgi:hypothetical protein